MTECVHYWLIEPPEGPESEGFCKRCGSRRRFKNFSQLSFGGPRKASDEDTERMRAASLLLYDPSYRPGRKTKISRLVGRR